MGNLEEWIFQNLEVKFSLTECKILFDIPDNNNDILNIVNFLALLTKWFMNNSTQEKEIYFIDLL